MPEPPRRAAFAARFMFAAVVADCDPLPFPEELAPKTLARIPIFVSFRRSE
jgi:hypothetical protein